MKSIHLSAARTKAGKITIKDLLIFAHKMGCELIISFEPKIKPKKKEDKKYEAQYLPKKEV